MRLPVRRHSIREPVTLEGIGLHLGHDCRLTFRPAEGGRGVVFRRTDLPGAPETPARVEHAVASERRTQLGEGDAALHTVEHVLAAVAGLEIDDLVIEMDAPEPPILDGSAAPFVEALERAGLADRPGAVEYLDLAAPVRVRDGESTYEAHPAPALTLDVGIDFPHPLIGAQHGRYAVTRASFRRELAPARTFGFVHEVEALRSRGLIRGASTANAVVLDEHGVVDATLRWPDEFVRHKAMDCVGDLALAGRRVRARVVANKPSHRGTVTLVREMVKHAAMLKHAAEEPRMLGIEEIMKVLAHRYPFLLVDRILEVEPGKRVVGIKNVTINEPFFQGHFPGHPIMPGVLIVEAMAQVGGMLLLGAVPEPDSKIVYFTSLNNVKWRRPVRPGDQIRFELEMLQVRGMMCKMTGVAKVDGEVVCEAEMGAVVRDR
ncbi:MAG TPA: bifunctional UDP-3-O-[3-hydroxymyristoyl] N-acetylglucosamine deacetylase/3-hydroxyacyl-ACP dehydratase [Gemmatimonadaceae bacterium]|nr:bifunctional UDP-3-O-[3-hydroxymyristoyl] N-acetylglucosamine deacetylase/3-hydroxyacyl-ACP dehydratase [Gemmatimonadaceae bacterium]